MGLLYYIITAMYTSWDVHTNIRIRVYSALTVYPDRDTWHDSAGRHPFGPYVDMDVCVHSPGSIHCCDYVTEEGSSPCGVVAAAVCTHNCCVYCGVLTF